MTVAVAPLILILKKFLILHVARSTLFPNIHYIMCNLSYINTLRYVLFSTGLTCNECKL